MDKQSALLHASRGAQGDQTSLASAIRAALLGDGNRTYAGNPNGIVTPEVKGEYLWDTTNGVMFRAMSLTNTSWAVIETENLSSVYAEHFDDFVGDALASNWAAPTKGSDAATVDFAHLAAGLGGQIRGTTGAGAGGTMAANGIQLHSALQWKANQGCLVFESRVKMSAITNICVFVGLTDQIAALEMPVNSAASANTITTNATDAVGFMFDTSMSTDNWWAVGVANDVDATAQNLAVAPVADTFETLRIELTTAGVATFKRNGSVIGSAMTGAVTATVALTPVIAAFTRTAASANITADFIKTRALRA